MESLGRYQLIKKLATGGMAEVFLASAEGPGGFSKQLVVKRILPHHADNPQFVQMFLSEAKLAAQLDHPNIVQVFDFGQAGGHYYLAMEFVDGMNLRSLNRMHRIVHGPIPMALCARMISHACEGLYYAHNFKDPKTGRPVNLVHRDISPDNLIVSKHGAVKVLDFGIAKAETQVHHTSTGMLKGKMAYMPPEQLQREPLDQRADVYALGVVLFELLAGSLPFDATSEVSIIQAVMKPDPMPPLSQVLADVPPQLEQCVARALTKSRDHRYGDCKAFQRDLESYIQATQAHCLPSDLAQLVSNAEQAHTAPTANGAERPYEPQGQMATSTFISPNAGRPTTSVSDTQLRRVTGEQPATLQPRRRTAEQQGLAPTEQQGPAPVAPRKSRSGVLIGLGLLAVAAGLGSWVVLTKTSLLGDSKPLVAPLPLPKDPPLVAGVDAGGAPEVAAGDDAGAPSSDGGATAVAVVAAAPDAGEAPGKPATKDGKDKPPKHVGTKVPPPPPAGKTGQVEVRVRPYAVLYVDGEKVGQTPLEEPLSLPAGKHTFRMVNDKFEKDVSVDFVVKPGKSVFKYNLNE